MVLSLFESRELPQEPKQRLTRVCISLTFCSAPLPPAPPSFSSLSPSSTQRRLSNTPVHPVTPTAPSPATQTLSPSIPPRSTPLHQFPSTTHLSTPLCPPSPQLLLSPTPHPQQPQPPAPSASSPSLPNFAPNSTNTKPSGSVLYGAVGKSLPYRKRLSSHFNVWELARARRSYSRRRSKNWAN